MRWQLWKAVHAANCGRIEHSARQRLSFGAEVEVIEPAQLRSEVLKQARGVVALYPRTAD